MPIESKFTTKLNSSKKMNHFNYHHVVNKRSPWTSSYSTEIINFDRLTFMDVMDFIVNFYCQTSRSLCDINLTDSFRRVVHHPSKMISIVRRNGCAFGFTFSVKFISKIKILMSEWKSSLYIVNEFSPKYWLEAHFSFKTFVFHKCTFLISRIVRKFRLNVIHNLVFYFT